MVTASHMLDNFQGPHTPAWS